MCTRPQERYLQSDGSMSFRETKHTVSSYMGACGQCVQCRMRLVTGWTIRCAHEAHMHGLVNCFVTATLDDEHLTQFAALDYSVVQKAFKRIRFAGFPFRFYLGAEYGTRPGDLDLMWLNAEGRILGRPHWHWTMFGQDFRFDRIQTGTSGAGHKLYESPTLSKLWGQGKIVIEDVSPESFAYVAKHYFKRVTGRNSDLHYSRVEPHTGEVILIRPEHTVMSRKPGIGVTWWNKFGRTDVMNQGNVLFNGHLQAVPKFYRSLWEKSDPSGYLGYLDSCIEFSALHQETPERLAVIEEVKLMKLAEARKRRGGIF